MGIDGSYRTVVGGSMSFCVVVAEVGDGGFPVNFELVLFDSVFQPIHAHVGSFQVFCFHGVIEDAVCSSIVGFNGGGRLWVSHVFEGISEYSGFAGVGVECTDFGFGGGGADVLEDLDEIVNRSVE